MPPTDDERATITEVIADRDARDVGRWHRVLGDDDEWDPDLPRFDNELLAQWQDDNDRIAVFVERGEHTVGDREGEPYYSAGATSVDAGLMFNSKSLERRAEMLETALDAAIDYLERTDPGVDLPAFSMRISGGVLDPLADFLRRFGAGSSRWTIRGSGIHAESMGFNSGVDFEITPDDMEACDVEREGAFTVDNDDLYDLVDNFGRTDVIPVALGGDAESPRLSVGPVSTRISLAIDYTERDLPEPADPDFRFTAPGLDFRDVSRFVNGSSNRDRPTRPWETVAIGVLDGVPIMHGDDPETGERATARFDATAVSGDGLVTVDNFRVAAIRAVDPRFSETDVTVTGQFDAPLLAELSVDGTGVDLRLMLEEAAIPTDVPIPPAEITPPGEPPDEAPPEPDDDEPETPVGRVAREAAAAGADEPPEDDDTPAPAEPEEPPDTPPEEPPMPQLSRSQIETIVEGATLGIDASAQLVGSTLREVKLRPDFDAGVPFTTESAVIAVTAADGTANTIRKAVLRWAELTDLGSLTDEQVEAINEARQALDEQFDVGLPPLEVGPAAPGEEAPPRAGGLTDDELFEIVERATDGIIPSVSINPDIDALRIELDPDPRSSTEFTRDLRDITGTPDDPVTAINEALAEWEAAADLNDAIRMSTTRERERLEADFDIDLLELGDEPPEATVEAGETPDTEPEGIWARVKQIALDQSIPAEDREHRIAEVLEPQLADEYPDLFDELVVVLKFTGNQGGGQPLEETLMLELGGNLSGTGRQQLAVPRTIRNLVGRGSVDDPEAIWEDFVDLVDIFDPRADRFADLTARLDTIADTTAFRIEEGVADFGALFLPPEMAREIVRRNSEVYVQGVLGHMEDESNAWYAAQRVNECANGIEQVCGLIEREISGTNRRGYREWYLAAAYRIFLETGAFDPGRFLHDWHDVFRPGETEADALDRRGPVDLETLGRPGAEPQPEPTPEPEAEPEPTPEPEAEPGPEAPTPTPAVQETATITVDRRDGQLVYMATDDVPDDVQDAIETAAASILGPPDTFDRGDVVGEVSITGSEIVDVDLSEGRRVLELLREPEADTATDERALSAFREEIRERM